MRSLCYELSTYYSVEAVLHNGKFVSYEITQMAV